MIQTFAVLLPHSSVTLYNVGITIFCSLQSRFCCVNFEGFNLNVDGRHECRLAALRALIGKQQISKGDKVYL